MDRISWLHSIPIAVFAILRESVVRSLRKRHVGKTLTPVRGPNCVEVAMGIRVLFGVFLGAFASSASAANVALP